MSTAPMTKIGNRQLQLLARARMLEAHQYLTSAEISALHPNDAGKDRLMGTLVAPKQIARLRAVYDIHGRRPTRSGVKRTGGFCGALQRYRKHQLRAEAQKLRARARALDKVAQRYVFRPSEVVA